MLNDGSVALMLAVRCTRFTPGLRDDSAAKHRTRRPMIKGRDRAPRWEAGRAKQVPTPVQAERAIRARSYAP